jgi:hypothetical protein
MNNLLQELHAFNIDKNYKRIRDLSSEVDEMKSLLSKMEAELKTEAHNMFDNIIAKMSVSYNVESNKVKLIMLYRMFSENAGYSLKEDKQAVEDNMSAFNIIVHYD